MEDENSDENADDSGEDKPLSTRGSRFCEFVCGDPKGFKKALLEELKN